MAKFVDRYEDLSITRVDTESVLSTLHTLFTTVTSGDDYNKDQVKSATNIANSMVKVLRFEFDVYKHFHDRVATAPQETSQGNARRMR
jgi:hypothetical protein